MKVYNTQVSSTTTINPRGTVSKDGFLRILSAQLQNQDPMNAKDNTEYIAQMAQFTALEQMQNLNASMNNLLLSQKVNEGNLLIGRNVVVEQEDGSIVTGEVIGTSAAKGKVNIIIDNKEYSVDDVVIVLKKDDEQAEPTGSAEGTQSTGDSVTEGSEEDVLSDN